MIAKNWTRVLTKDSKDLFQGKTYEELTKWYDFHARQYDAALGRWFGVDALGYKMPGMSPYNAMANNPVMFLDPDGNEPITLALGLLLLKKMAIGAAIGGGITGAAYTASAALSSGGLSQNWQWSQFGKSVGIGAAMGALSGGTKALGKLGYGTLKPLANALGGGVNMMNYHDPDKGFGLHSLGYFAAGYLGTSVGLSEGGAAGFFAGGVMNNFAGFAAGDIHNSYGMAQHFVGGGLASVAGKNFYSSAGKAMGLKKTSNYFFGDALVDKAVSYGLQNVASNFAFDGSQSYFESGAGLKIGGSFLVGAFGGMGQYGLMKGGGSENPYGGFGKLFGLSTLSYLGEYSANNLWNSGNRYPSYRSYYRYKQSSLAIKSMFYTFIGMP